MIITRTPLRISFAGGGTDLPSFYRKYGGGRTTSAAIDKYVHVLVNDKFDESIRVAYSKTENVDTVEELQHPIVREAMQIAGITSALEIHTIADIPSEGSGLGSSSTFAVGLLNALFAARGKLKDPAELAETACQIEIERLKGAAGKQDQYIAALGGIQHFEFHADDSVRAQPIPLSRTHREELSDHLSLYYTGITRSADGLLRKQSERTESNRESLFAIRDLADRAREALLHADFAVLGGILDQGWKLKRELAAGITTTEIDRVYEKAQAAGAYGGKVTGAGGGGFLLLVHPPERSHQIATAVSPMRRLPVRVTPEGSRILFVGQ